MPKDKSPFRRAAGKLTSAIQKEWIEELGTDAANESEDVMHKAQALLRATIADEAVALLAEKSVSAYLGEAWVKRHPNVKTFIAALEAELPQ